MDFSDKDQEKHRVVVIDDQTKDLKEAEGKINEWVEKAGITDAQ